MPRTGLVATAFCASWLAATLAAAAEPLSVSPGGPPQAGSTPTVKTTAASSAAAARRPPPRRPTATAGSLGAPGGPDCEALRRQYQQSQECFAPYRLANGGLKAEATRRCKVVTNPSPQCGPLVGK